MVFVAPAFSMVRYVDPVFGMSACSSICSSVYICIIPNFDHNVQVNFLRTIKATVMILGINFHLGMTTQAAVAICDLNLFFTFHQLCKFAWHDIAFRRILVNSLFPFLGYWSFGLFLMFVIMSAPDQRGTQIHTFLISLHKRMSWMFTRSASLRFFCWVPTTYIFIEK